MRGGLGEEGSGVSVERSSTTADDTTPVLTRYSALFLSSSVTGRPSNIFSVLLLEIACALHVTLDYKMKKVCVRREEYSNRKGEREKISNL